MVYFGWLAATMMISEVLVVLFSTAVNHTINTMFNRFKLVPESTNAAAHNAKETTEKIDVKKILRELEEGQYPDVKNEQAWISHYNLNLQAVFIFFVNVIFLSSVLYLYVKPFIGQRDHWYFIYTVGSIFVILLICYTWFYIHKYRAFVSVPKLMQENGISSMAEIIRQIKRQMTMEALFAELMTICSFGTVIATFTMNG